MRKRSLVRVYLFLCAVGLWGLACESGEDSGESVPVGEKGKEGSGDYYMVFFKDKQGTPFRLEEPVAFLSTRSIERRERQHIEIKEGDLPVVPSYVEEIEEMGVVVHGRTRWMNGVLVRAEECVVDQISSLSYVRAVAWVAPGGYQKSSSASNEGPPGSRVSASALSDVFTHTEHQILGIDQMHDEKLRGEGVYCAVIDASFWGVDKGTHFSHIFEEGRLIDTWSFTYRRESVYVSQLNAHGTLVLSVMAAYVETEKGRYVGAAYKSHYALYETEASASEYRIEEYHWLLAAERADSLGVDIIQSSLGYDVFDVDTMSYSREDFNGQVSVISRAARLAYERGMLVIVGAGNEGEQGLTMPADAVGVLAVGSVDKDLKRATFSAVGPTVDQRIKPDVVALGKGVLCVSPLAAAREEYRRVSGTSYSAPLVSGLAAGLWQLLPHKTNAEIADLLKQSGHRAHMPDYMLGYGVPDFRRAKLEAEVP